MGGVIPPRVFGTYSTYPPVYSEGNRVGQVTLYPFDLRPFPFYTDIINNERRNHGVLHLNRPLDHIRVPA